MSVDTNAPTSSEMVELGPLEEIDLDRVLKFLGARNVAYEISIDEDMRDQQLARHNEGIRNPRAFRHAQLAFTFIQISSSDMERIAPELEETGLYTRSTGEDELSAEDYMCVACDFHSFEPGMCPTCKITLKDYSSYVAHQSSEKAGLNKAGIWVIIALVLGMVALLNFTR